MKKVWLSAIALFCVVTAANAQEGGQKWIGGSIGFVNEEVKDGKKTNSYNITPEFGYAFSDKWAIGIRLGYSHEDSKANKDATKIKEDGFLISPFARYSFLRGNVGNLFLDGGVDYGHTKVKDGAKTNMIGVGIRPGVSVNLTQKLALTGTFGFLGYQHQKSGDIKINRFAADFKLNNVSLGVNYRF